MRSRIKGRSATTSANVGLVSSVKIADRIHLLAQKMFNQLGRTVESSDLLLLPEV
jgi:hypothetical protein